MRHNLQEVKVFQGKPLRNLPFVTFYKNPMLTDLMQMVPRGDMRGLSDGKNIFVWDALDTTHRYGAWAILNAGMWEGEILEPLYAGDKAAPKYDYESSTFFLFDPENMQKTIDDSTGWVDDNGGADAEVKLFRLAKNVAVSILSGNKHLPSISAFARLMRKATLMTIEPVRESISLRTMIDLIESLSHTLTYYHVTLAENLHDIMENGLRPSIGDRSKQLGEKSLIFLFPDEDSAEDAVSTWMGDQFDDDVTLALLEIVLPPEIEVFKTEDIDWEYFTKTDIPPSCIRVVSKNF